jgi:L-amino acid N-acyltransferase YncA
LMRDVQQGPARVLGETAGLLGPAMVTQFAPQIAGGLLRAGDNLAAPAALNRQAGAVKSPSVVFKSVSDSPEKWMAKQNAEYRGFDEIYSGKDLKLIHKMTDEAGYGDVVAIKNGKVIGTTFYGPHGTNAASKTLEGAVEVHPDFRRQGVATKMYDAIEKITGKKLSPADSKTPLADAFWRSRK